MLFQDCPNIYVDAISGLDTNPGTLDFPYATLTQAMLQASEGDTIILAPGTYGPGETFPIDMKHRVHIQGTSALDTVLVGGGSDVLRFTASTNGDYLGTFYDGFMIQGAACAITMEGEFWSSKPTFSNLVLAQNTVGICMEAIDLEGLVVADDQDPDPEFPSHNYYEHRPRIVNLTITMNEIGIRDRTWEINNNARTLSYGASEPAILNCIIRWNNLDLSGIDGSDLASSHYGTVGGVTKPLKPALLPPTPLAASPSDVFIDPVSSDFRLLPSAAQAVFDVLVDTGSQTGLGFHGNLTTISTGDQCHMIWDADMEGYCDDRVEGPEIDLGADEMGEFIIAGFAPFTRNFSTGYYTATIWGNPQPGMAAGTLQMYMATNYNVSTNQYLDWLPLPIVGLRTVGTTAPTPMGGYGTQCVDAQFDANNPITLTAKVPVTITFSPSVLRFNMQVSFVDSTPALSQISNLQTFQVL